MYWLFFYLFLMIIFLIYGICLNLIIFFILFFLLFLYLLFLNFKYLVLLFFIFPIVFNLNSVLNQKINNNYYHQGIITKTYNSSFIIKENNNFYYIYSNQNVYVGDIISFEGNYTKINEIDDFSLFLISNKVLYCGNNINNINVLESNNSIRNNKIKNLQNNPSKYSNYTLLLIFKKENKNNKYLADNFEKLGIEHLFVISGFHIGIIYLLIFYIFKPFIKKRNILQIIASTISFYFLYLTFFPISGIRAWIYRNIETTKIMSKNNSLIFTALIMLLLNPFSAFSISLILSFSITFLIININQTIWNKNKKTIYISLFSFCLASSLITIWNQSINIFAPIITIICSPLIVILYTFIIIFLPFKFLWIYLNPFFIFFDLIFYLLSFIYFPIFIPTFPLILHFLIFLILFILLIKLLKKYKKDI